MKAQRRFGLALSWPRLTAVFLVDVLILVLASHLPESWQGRSHVAWWVGVGLAPLVTLLSLVTYHGITVTSAVGHVVCGIGRLTRAPRWPRVYARRRLPAPLTGATRSACGEYEGQLVTVIAVGGGEEKRPRAIVIGRVAPTHSAVRRRSWRCASSISTSTSIDIVSVGARRAAMRRSCPIDRPGRIRSRSRSTPARRSQHLAGVADEPAAQRRRRRGPRFAGFDSGGGHRAARPRISTG